MNKFYLRTAKKIHLFPDRHAMIYHEKEDHFEVKTWITVHKNIISAVRPEKFIMKNNSNNIGAYPQKHYHPYTKLILHNPLLWTMMENASIIEWIHPSVFAGKPEAKNKNIEVGTLRWKIRDKIYEMFSVPSLVYSPFEIVEIEEENFLFENHAKLSTWDDIKIERVFEPQPKRVFTKAI